MGMVLWRTGECYRNCGNSLDYFLTEKYTKFFDEARKDAKKKKLGELLLDDFFRLQNLILFIGDFYKI